MNSLESWREVTAPANLRDRVFQGKRRTRVQAVSLAVSAAAVMGIAIFFISSSKPAAAALYKRMYGAFANSERAHWVFFGGKNGIDGPGAEWTNTWYEKGWMRRDGLGGKRALKGPDATWGFDPDIGTVQKYDRPGQILPHPLQSAHNLVPSSPEDVTSLGPVSWNGREFDVVEASIEDDDNQRFKIWIDRQSSLPAYLEIESTLTDKKSPRGQIWIFYNDPVPDILFDPEKLSLSADELQTGLSRRNLEPPPRP